MGKYEALGNFLSKHKTANVRMSFAEIERVIGAKLPSSQRYPAWWSNNPSNNPMTKVWLDAGFQTEQVDIAGRKLVFRKVAVPLSGSDDQSDAPRGKHPLFGCMRGTMTIEADTDLAAPADSEWAAIAFGQPRGQD